MMAHRRRVSPQQNAQKWTSIKEDQDGFEKRFVSPSIGNGIFTTKAFDKGQFLLEYRGNLEEASVNTEDEDNVFRFFFRHNNVNWSIDASHDTCLARWINDEHQHPNCVMKKMVFLDGQAHLCLFSLRDISANEELRYDYGIEDLPWRKLETAQDSTGGGSERCLAPDDQRRCDVSFKHSDDPASCGSEKLLAEPSQKLETARDSTGGGSEKLLAPDDQSGCNVRFKHSDDPAEKLLAPDDQSGCDVRFKHSDDPAEKLLAPDEQSGCDVCFKPSDDPASCGSEKLALDDKRQFDVSFKPADVGGGSGKLTVSDEESESEVSSKPSDVEEVSDSDVSFKPSDDESSEGFVPESSDDEFSRPVSPVLLPGMNYDRHDSQDRHGLEDSRHSCTMEADSTLSVSTSSTNQAGKVSSAHSLSEIQVFTTSNRDGRTYDKPQYCPFCSLPQKKLPRHLQTPQHKDEAQVQQWLATDDKKEKDRQLSLMRNYGNFLHNCSVLQEGKGVLIVVYRPAYDVNPNDYLPCQDCYGYFAKNDLWKHRCCQKTEEETDDSFQPNPSRKKKRFGLCKASRMMLPTVPGVSQRTHEILSRMNNDNTARVAKSDPLIRKFAEKLTMKHGHSRDQEGYIRQRVREVSRLVLEYRVLTGERNAVLSDLISPPKFETVTRATRVAAGFNEDTHLYMTPSLALKIGHSLKICVEILKGEALISGDEFIQKKCKGFLSLYALHWEEKVSHHALRSLNETRRNNPKLLPMTGDIMKLSKHLKEHIKTSQEKLKRADGPEVPRAWRRLAEALLTQVVVFNRKRPGEVSKMTIEDFNKCRSGEGSIVEGALSKWEKALCRVLWRFEIIGKRSRTVAVLLTADMKEAMNTLMAKRSEAHIADDNLYFFALQAGEGHIRACDCLREHSSLCGAEHPEYLRATRLRKQIATVSQIMNLKENELDVLANFLGHDIRTHRQYYRLPDSTMQVAKVSKVLMKMERGDLEGLAGKTLADVEVQPNEEYNTDAESDDSESDAANAPKVVLPCAVGKGKKASTARTRKVPTLKRAWSTKEKAAVAAHMGYFLRSRTLPTKAPIMALLKREPETFAARTWRNVKDFLRNQIRKQDPMSFMKY